MCLIKVIEERIQTFNIEEVAGKNGEKNNKQRLVFLDSLIAQMHAEKLSFGDIQEEVDTFMFEGHDTTAAALNFFCYLVGCHPDIQAKIHAEIDTIFGGKLSSSIPRGHLSFSLFIFL
jgi:cytochrome P450 family 4 subfamily V